MSQPVLISICIPAYQRTQLLQRLLNSIAQQTFRDFEVVITDDSKDDSVQQLLAATQFAFPVVYHKNISSLGTPENWNEAIRRAKGAWIKLMHDDDWFSSENSLQEFAAAAEKGSRFIFSAYTNIFLETGKEQPMFFPSGWRRRILKNPVVLLPRNVIGPPSVTLVHRSVPMVYDARLKWRVDMEYYIRVLQSEQQFFYISQPLVSVGISASQVTNSCIDQPEVELPEGLILLQKHGVAALRNIRIYDAWWRIIRNVGVRETGQLQRYTGQQSWPQAILLMVGHVGSVPERLLHTGVFSKMFMAFSYLLNFKNLKNP